MNSTLIMAIVLILIVVATVITKKAPFNFVLFIVPILCALILGYSVEETSTFIVEQLASMMKSAGLCCCLHFYTFRCLRRQVCLTRSYLPSLQSLEIR